MEDIVINHVPSNTVLARDIIIDLMPTPPFTAAVAAEFHWRFEDEPESEYLFLGKGTVGFDYNVGFPFVGREIRISMTGVASGGARSTYDPREGVQWVISIPSPTDDILTLDGDVLTLDGDPLTLS
jgi:hypothetical protein